MKVANYAVARLEPNDGSEGRWLVMKREREVEAGIFRYTEVSRHTSQALAVVACLRRVLEAGVGGQ